MMWNPLEAIKKKLKGTPPDAAPAAPGGPPAKAGATPPEGVEDIKGLEDLEKKGMLSKFFRHWKDPAFLKQMRHMVARMQADGVNVKDRKAVQDWIMAHKDEIEAGKFKEAAPDRPQTYVKTGPDIGRNDPCACGSGKKHKKCCGK